MKLRHVIFAACALALVSTAPKTSCADAVRPAAEALPVPPGATRDQVLLGDRIFHGEAAGGKCFTCHGSDAKGTGTGNDLTLGMWVWGDGSMRTIKATIVNNMKIAPGMDGDLSPEDVDAVVAYVWALGHQKRQPDRRVRRRHIRRKDQACPAVIRKPVVAQCLAASVFVACQPCCEPKARRHKRQRRQRWPAEFTSGAA